MAAVGPPGIMPKAISGQKILFAGFKPRGDAMSNAPDIPSLSTFFFHITQRCNLSCRHCWINPVFTAEPPADGEEITLATMRSLVEQALPLGLKNIKITGGEPFLRADILDFIAYFTAQKLPVSIETNGTLLTPELVKALKTLRVSLVAVSIDGKNAASHDAIRGVPGAFDRALHGLRLLQDHDIPREIVSVLHRRNLDEVEDLLRLSDELGVRVHKLNPISSVGRGKGMDQGGELLSVSEILRLNQTLETRWRRQFKTRISLDIPVAFKSLASVHEAGFCRCGIKGILGILADGRLALCGIGESCDDLIFGHGERDDLQQVWEQSRVLSEIRSWLPARLEGICGQCLLKNYCMGRCRANVYFNSGSLTGPFPFCQQAHQEGLFPASRRYDQGSAAAPVV
jgi:SynChlorMet cassette radical SAM/SPASM protein ScmF